MATEINIRVKVVLTKAHNSIRKVERYYRPLQRVYQIIMIELGTKPGKLGISKEIGLQMALKAINDIASPRGLVPILLVYRAYS